MSIEIKKSIDTGKLKLFIDGIEVNNSYVLSFDSIQILDENDSKLVTHVRFDELAIIEKLYLLPLEKLSSKVNLNAKIRLEERENYNCNIEFHIQPDIEKWNNPFTFATYKQKFLEYINPEQSNHEARAP